MKQSLREYREIGTISQKLGLMNIGKKKLNEERRSEGLGKILKCELRLEGLENF